jgi:hypothetical protein
MRVCAKESKATRETLELTAMALFCALCLLAACSSAGPSRKVGAVTEVKPSDSAKTAGQHPQHSYNVAGDFVGGGQVGDVLDDMKINQKHDPETFKGA